MTPASEGQCSLALLARTQRGTLRTLPRNRARSGNMHDVTGGDEVAELRDALAIRSLCDRYAFAVDAGDVPAVASLFTPDGHLASNYEGGDWHFHGREQIAETVIAGAKGIAPTTMHVVGSHHAEVDADTATGITYCIANHLRDDRSNLVQMVRYLDRFARSDGEWLIADRQVDILWTESRPAAP
jgi:uncharacterized protein (TIGR02246 family)